MCGHNLATILCKNQKNTLNVYGKNKIQDV